MDRPILVVGAPRSGTTWVQRILLSHPRVRGGQESQFFCHFAPALRVFRKSGQRHRYIGLDNYWTADELSAEIHRLWRKTMLPMVDERTDLLVEKTPDHALWMEEIHRLLPAARFVHVIRDSRAVCASLLAANREAWGQGWTPTTARQAADRWYASVSVAREVGATLGSDSYTELFYEDLVDQPLAQIRRLFQFAALDLSDEDARRIAEEQSFEHQKTIGGTPFRRTGALADQKPGAFKEPAGFFRKGRPDAWKSELSLFQKLVVWRHTRNLMRACGYDRRGCRHSSPVALPGPAPIKAQLQHV